MTIEIDWLIPGRIVLHRFSGIVTLEDTTQASLEGPELASKGQPPVHMFVDLATVTHFPLSVRQLEIAIRHNPHLDRLGWVVILVPHNPVLRFVATILTQIRYSKLRFLIVEDRAQGMCSFLKHDPSLAGFISPAGDLIPPPAA